MDILGFKCRDAFIPIGKVKDFVKFCRESEGFEVN
jgi:hypothetical protein